MEDAYKLIPELLRKVGMLPSVPISATIALTSECNFRCRYCFATGIGQQKSMDKKVIDRIIKQIVKYDILNVHITGGEPFLEMEKLTYLLKRLTDNNISFSVLTNGTFIDQDSINFLKRFFSNSVSRIQISMDASNETTFNFHRKKGYFQKTLDAIKLLTDNQINTRVNFVATHQNVGEVFDAYKLVNSLGVHDFSISPVYPRGKGESLYALLDAKQLINEYIKIIYAIEEEGYLTRFHPRYPLELYNLISSEVKEQQYHEDLIYHLSGELTQVLFNVDGSIYPGSMLSDPAFKLGNISNDDLLDIWNNLPPILVNKRDLSSSKCNVCKFRNSCRGGDLLKTFRAYGNFDHPDPDCKYTPEILL